MPNPYKFEHLNVTCPGCFPPIDLELKHHQKRLKIKKWHLDDINKIATVYIEDENELSDEEIEHELRFVLKDWLPATPPSPKKHYHGWHAGIGLLTGITFMVLMLLGIALPGWLHLAMIFGGSLLTIILGWPSYRKAFAALTSKQKFFNMDTLFSISTLAAIVVTILHLFIPIMPILIDAALMIFGFRRAGLWLEENVTQGTLKNERFVDRGRKILIQRKMADNYIDCELHDVGMDNIIKIRAGQCIPLNGLLMQEKSDITFTLHTGKIEPVTLKQGDHLCAGMIAQEDILMKVTALEDQSYLRLRDLSLIQAQMQKAPITNTTQKIMNWFLPGVLLGAACMLGAGYWLGMAITIKAALYLLVCACPCALGLVTALAINIGLTKTKEQGLLFNTAKGLQAATDIDMAVFDLNGTLTFNKPQVVGQPTVHKDYFDIIHAMESQSQHPIAKGIKEYIGEPSSQIKFDSFLKSDNGITATLNGNIYQIGNAAFIHPPAKMVPKNLGNAQHVIYFMKNGKVEGHFLLEDPLRDDAAFMINNLYKNKIKIRLLTGANRDTANQYARQLNIPSYWIQTDCTPKTKNIQIQHFKSQGHRVAMFGDSGNDIDAMASAHLSVAITSPATDPMSEQLADATLNNRSLLPILQIFAVGRQTMNQIKQNLTMSFVYNTLSLGFVVCAVFLMPALLNPAFGAALMAIQSACILGNAYRIKHQEARLPFQDNLKPQKNPSPIEASVYLGGSNVLFSSLSSSISSRDSNELKDDNVKKDERRDNTDTIDDIDIAEVEAGRLVLY